MLGRVERECEMLLAQCFENYPALSEGAPGGLLEGGQVASLQPAPALHHAVHLCSAAHNCVPSYILHLLHHRPQLALQLAWTGLQAVTCCQR